MKIKACLLSLVSVISACDSSLQYETHADAQGHTAPTAATIASNKAVLEKRPFSNTQDFDDANRGLIAQDTSLITEGKSGKSVWDMTAYHFVDQQKSSPDSVNPSLWRQAKLNNIHGLFKVTDKIYQLRGYDLANMTIIQGDTGWIIVDPLTSTETASKAFKFAQQHLGEHPVRAILITHSHIDHFGGVEGILQHMTTTEKADLQVITPEGFMEESTSENIMTGTAMGRRATLMYGKRLARSIRGHVDTGLGKAPAFGYFEILEPTKIIKTTGETLNVDGIDFEFQIVSGSEAPSEFTFYLPQFNAFCGAELLSRNMHNLYTLRGAKVRDGQLWASYIDEALNLFNKADVYFASHHWPMWGKANIQEFMATHRDTYKYIHDQSVRMINAGYTPNEIAENIEMPEALNKHFYNQGYYGTVKHNAKAVYQHYIGWYNGNPAKLDPLPETESSIRYVNMMGGSDAIIAKAQIAFDESANERVESSQKTYRWLAELLNHVVFAEPDNAPAKALLAKVYDQLGYQAESGPWRDVYLSGAYELRHGSPDDGIDMTIMKGLLMKTPVENFFYTMSGLLHGPDANGKKLTVKITFSDLNESYLLTLNNSVLHHRAVTNDTKADTTLTITHPLFIDLMIGKASLKDTLFGDDLSVEGSKIDLFSFFSLIDKPKATFNIVTP